MDASQCILGATRIDCADTSTSYVAHAPRLMTRSRGIGCCDVIGLYHTQANNLCVSSTSAELQMSQDVLGDPNIRVCNEHRARDPLLARRQ